jgi:hypothetical protein
MTQNRAIIESQKKNPDLWEDIKMRRFEWLRHVIRMDQIMMAHNNFASKTRRQ